MRTLLVAAVAAASWLAAPVAHAAEALQAEVWLVTPDHSGQLPRELEGMRRALQRRGYSGAHVDRRERVTLDRGEPVHVDLGRREVDLTLLSLGRGQARVQVRRGEGKAKITSVSTDDARFLVTAPR